MIVGAKINMYVSHCEKQQLGAGGPTLKSYRHEAKMWMGGWDIGKFSQKVMHSVLNLAIAPALHSKAVLKHLALIVSFLLLPLYCQLST